MPNYSVCHIVFKCQLASNDTEVSQGKSTQAVLKNVLNSQIYLCEAKNGVSLVPGKMNNNNSLLLMKKKVSCHFECLTKKE